MSIALFKALASIIWQLAPGSSKNVTVRVMAHLSIQISLHLIIGFLFLTHLQQLMFTVLLKALERQVPSSVQNVWQNQDGLHSHQQRY